MQLLHCGQPPLCEGRSGQQSVDFINVVAWRQQAEFVSRYFKKGNPILICGQLQTRSWSDNQGQKRYTTEVVADEVSFVGAATEKKEQVEKTPPDPSKLGGSYIPTAYTSQPSFEIINDDGDLPF